MAGRDSGSRSLYLIGTEAQVKALELLGGSDELPEVAG